MTPRPASLLAIALVIAPTARAQETGGGRGTDTPLAQVRALAGEYDRVRAAFSKKLRALETVEQRRVLWAKRPTRDILWMPRFWKIAEAQTATEAGFEALLWIRNHSGSVDDAHRSVALLCDHHMDHPRLGELCKRFRYGRDVADEEVLKRILANSPHRGTRALAAFALACNRENRDATKHEGEIVELLERVVRDGGGVRGDGRLNPNLSLVRLAEIRLFGIRHLKPGKKAPPIEGEDIAGKLFRLSDYRGKVVLLDFWGHW